MTVKVREIPKGSGKWWVKIDWHQRRVSKLFETKERAEQVAETLTVALDLYGEEALKMFRRQDPIADAEPPPIPTIAEFAEKWKAELERRDLKLSTRMSYLSNLKHHILPALGELPITDVDYSVLKNFVCGKVDATYSSARFRKPAAEGQQDKKPAGAERRYSRDSVRIMVQTMRALMSEAVLEKLIPENPVKNLARFYRKQKRERAVRRSDVYQPEELYKVEDVLRAQPAKFETDAYEFFLCLSRTGMRVGEARGLQLQDLDLDAGTIEIQRNIPSGHGQLEESTKGKSGHRTVDMGRDVQAALRAMLRRRIVEGMKAGNRMRIRWLFPAPKGGIRDYNRIHNDWSRAQRIADVRIRSPHSLRHTYASASLAAGEDAAYVAKQLGHANPEITLAIYTHFLRRRRRHGSSALDRLRTKPASDPQVKLKKEN